MSESSRTVAGILLLLVAFLFWLQLSGRLKSVLQVVSGAPLSPGFGAGGVGTLSGGATLGPKNPSQGDVRAYDAAGNSVPLTIPGVPGGSIGVLNTPPINPGGGGGNALETFGLGALGALGGPTGVVLGTAYTSIKGILGKFGIRW